MKTVIGRFAPIFLIGALAGCAPFLPQYSASETERETGFYTDLGKPALALLEYRLAAHFAGNSKAYSKICAGEGQRDRSAKSSHAKPLDAEAEAKLLARFDGLSPFSSCSPTERGYVDSVTGEAAAMFDVHELSCDQPTNCTAWGGYYGSGQHGWSFYRLTWNGNWRIKREPLDIIVTGDGQ